MASPTADDPYAPPASSAFDEREGGPFPPLEGRARVVRAMLVADIAVSVASAVAYEVAGLLYEDASSLERALDLASSVALVVSLAAFVTFLVWLHRAVLRLKRARRSIGASPGWAVGCWFVPVANLYLPYGFVRELWRKSAGETRLAGRPRTLLKIWWTAWIATNVGALLFGDWISGGASALGWLITACDLASTALLLYIVNAVTEAQRETLSSAAPSRVAVARTRASRR